MTRLPAIDPGEAEGPVRELLDAVQERLGMVPNLARTLGHSPAALGGYLALGEALAGGVLPVDLREQLALTVSEAHDCRYCVSAHCAIGQSAGLSDSELADGRQGSSPHRKVDAALRFARQLVERRGRVDDESLARLRRAGYGPAEITEIVALVAWKTLANYLNHVAGTEIDFPAAPQLANAS